MSTLGRARARSRRPARAPAGRRSPRHRHPPLAPLGPTLDVYIDLVDASRHKMVWQGVATFTLTDKMQEQLRESVRNTVASVFAEFPVAPAAAQ